MVHTALQRATIYQLFRSRRGALLCMGRPIDVLLEAMGGPTGHHPLQLYPAEFCACKAAEVTLNIGLGVESRNIAKATAQKREKEPMSPSPRGYKKAKQEEKTILMCGGIPSLPYCTTL